MLRTGMPLFPSKVTIIYDGVCFSWRWRSTCLPVGNDGWIPSLVLRLCTAFVFSYYTVFISTHGSLCFSYSLPIPLWDSEQMALWSWIAWIDLWPNCHHSNIKNCEGNQHLNLFQLSAVLSTINHFWPSPYYIGNIGWSCWLRWPLYQRLLPTQAILWFCCPDCRESGGQHLPFLSSRSCWPNHLIISPPQSFPWV